MLRRLDEMDYVSHRPYRGVRLTKRGTREAVEMIRHHRLLELYLAEVVGMPWDKVHAEADALEHHISEELESRLDELLGYPTEDPHGHPIPTPGLELDENVYPTLAQWSRVSVLSYGASAIATPSFYVISPSSVYGRARRSE